MFGGLGAFYSDIMMHREIWFRIEIVQMVLPVAEDGIALCPCHLSFRLLVKSSVCATARCQVQVDRNFPGPQQFGVGVPAPVSFVPLSVNSERELINPSVYGGFSPWWIPDTFSMGFQFGRFNVQACATMYAQSLGHVHRYLNTV